ncbi:MAG: Stp1/IreP family PP2C-type Ser/Thr phosphatase [Acidimicrobiales bacterium]
MQLRSGAATDVGRVRQSNQDQALQAEVLFAVADGMGGHAGGETAARIAVETLARNYAGKRSSGDLADAVRQANTAIWEESQSTQDLRGMGTTMTALALIDIDGAPHLAVAHVGDSRAYVLAGGELRQITQDHSLVEEMVRSGEISSEEATYHPKRHIVTRALGIEPYVEVDVWEHNANPADRYLLCSDGLINEVSDSEIVSVLARHVDPLSAARELVSVARAHGGSDNITVVVVDVIADSDSGAGFTSGETSSTHAVASPAESGSAPSVDNAAAEVAVAGGGDIRVPYVAHPPRRITARVLAFVTLVLVVIGGAVALVIWYAEHSYYVGLKGNQIVIYKGQVGGFLWMKPHVSEQTGLYSYQVSPARLTDLRHGMAEPSLAASRRYVSNLRAEAQGLGTNATPTTTTGSVTSQSGRPGTASTTPTTTPVPVG